LVAPTNMLLALRANLSGAMRSMVGVEVDQDLIKSSKTQIQARLRSLAIN
jgi:protein required for attachment to host cells